MATKDANKQVSIVLPKDIVIKIDKLAKDNYLNPNIACFILIFLKLLS